MSARGRSTSPSPVCSSSQEAAPRVVEGHAVGDRELARVVDVLVGRDQVVLEGGRGRHELEGGARRVEPARHVVVEGRRVKERPVVGDRDPALPHVEVVRRVARHGQHVAVAGVEDDRGAVGGRRVLLGDRVEGRPHAQDVLGERVREERLQGRVDVQHDRVAGDGGSVLDGRDRVVVRVDLDLLLAVDAAQVLVVVLLDAVLADDRLLGVAPLGGELGVLVRGDRPDVAKDLGGEVAPRGVGALGERLDRDAREHRAVLLQVDDHLRRGVGQHRDGLVRAVLPAREGGDHLVDRDPRERGHPTHEPWHRGRVET